MENLEKPRRAFIREAAILSTSFLLPWLEACNAGMDAAATPDFLSRIQEEKTLREIGAAYVKAFPEEASRSGLSTLLLGNEKGKVQGNTLINFLREKISNDFRSGNVVVIKGWVLSLTEARQCALFYLSFNS